VLAVTGALAVSAGYVLGHNVLPPPDDGGNAENVPSPKPAAGATTVSGRPPVVAAPGTAASAFPGAPTRVNEFGVPVGYPRTQAGAVSACGNYVSAYTSTANREPSRIRELFRSFSLGSESENFANRIVEADAETANNFGVQSVNSPELGFVLRVVGFRIDSFIAEEATVLVWSVASVGIYGGPPRLVPQEHWGTDICTVRWAGGDWKLLRASNGPDGPLSTERGATAFQQFVLVGDAR
jgi:hypothetical protein